MKAWLIELQVWWRLLIQIGDQPKGLGAYHDKTSIPGIQGWPEYLDPRITDDGTDSAAYLFVLEKDSTNKLVLQLNIQSQTYSKTNSFITEIQDSTFFRVHAVPTTPGVCYSSVGEASAQVAENSKGTVKEESQFEKPETEEKGTCTTKSTKVT